MPVRVAINGFGRTGRAMFRAAREQDADVEWAGINDVMGVESLARLLAKDSVYGRFSGKVEALDGAIRVDDTQVKVVAWYDNEWGYSSRLVELAQRILVPVPAG